MHYLIYIYIYIYSYILYYTLYYIVTNCKGCQVGSDEYFSAVWVR